MAAPQTNTFVVEAQIDAIPLDLEVTPNGAVAVVRGNIPQNDYASDAKLSFWRTDTGARVWPSQLGAVGRGNVVLHPTTGQPMFAESIAVTNDRIVSIASADTQPGIPGEDTTYVDILALSWTGGAPQVQVLATHELKTGANPTSATVMGVAHDVAITPDGSTAVVSHANWIHVFDLGDGSQWKAFNIGSADSPGQQGQCSPYFSRNSVEVTSGRAVVTAGRRHGTSLVARETWVYIVNLAVDPPVLMLEAHQEVPTMGTDQSPHDIAITPDGFKAVVSATGTVGLYDLTSGALVGTPFRNSTDDRHWGFTLVPDKQAPDLWHSVEVSNTHAVVLANSAYWLDALGDVWSVRVFALTGGLTQLAWYTGSTVYPGDTAWDVSLAPDGQVASIKTQFHDLAVPDVANPVTVQGIPWEGLFRAGPLGGAVGSPPVVYPTASSGAAGINDATVLLAPVGYEPVRRWAAFLGSTGSNQATLRFYDINAGTWPEPGPAVQTHTLSESNPNPFVSPADLELSPGGADVLARLTAPFAESSPQQGGPDWSRWGDNPPAQSGGTIGGQGTCVGADSLRMRRRAAVSISRDTSPGSTAGWVHIVKVL